MNTNEVCELCVEAQAASFDERYEWRHRNMDECSCWTDARTVKFVELYFAV